MRFLRRAGLAFLMVATLWLALLAFPQPLFAYRLSYKSYDIWSDRPIDPAIRTVLDDATRRLRSSKLYGPSHRFRIFFCNDNWRLALFSQRFSSGMGGVADGWLTRNIYLREADIRGNRIIPPWGILADADARPLSYFIAHEAAHVLQSRAFGRLHALRSPAWLHEGYADHVAKAGDFDFEENLRMLKAGHPSLDPLKSGLYRRHHLLVALLLDRQRRSIRDVVAAPPDEQALLEALR